jgi:hypothetical protein
MPRLHVVALLFGGMRRLFLNVMRRRSKKHQSVPMPSADAARLQLFLKFDERDVRRLGDRAKEKVSLGFDATRLAVAALPLWRDVALRLKPFTPADRARALTPNCSAALRHERPRSIASTTRRRRSKDRALTMHAGLLRQYAS